MIPLGLAGKLIGFGFLAGVLGGAASQIAWTRSDDTILNWSFNADGSFNCIGVYHAFFLSTMTGALLAMFLVIVASGKFRDEWSRDSIINALAVGYLLLLFSCLLGTDNIRGATLFSVAPLKLPLLCILLYIVVWVSVFKCRNIRLVFCYFISLVTTASVVTTLLVYCPVFSVNLRSLAMCLIATLFALCFISAPIEVTKFEHIVRSVPCAVTVFVTLSATVGGNWSKMHMIALLTVAGSLLLLSSCAYDIKDAKEIVRSLSSIAIMSALVGVDWSAQYYFKESGRMIDVILAIVFPILIIFSLQTWVRSNVKEMIDVEKVGDLKKLRPQRFVRYKTLMGFSSLSAVTMMSVLVSKDNSIEPQGSPAIIVSLRWFLVIVSIIGSYCFSYRSLIGNIFQIPGVKISRGQYCLVCVEAMFTAFACFAYGVGLIYMTPRGEFTSWLLLSLLYLLLTFLLPILASVTFPGSRELSPPLLITPISGVAQDTMSLSFINILGIGIPLWSTWRIYDVYDAALVVGVILVPMAPVFTLFLLSNLRHVDNEKERLAELGEEGCFEVDRIGGVVARGRKEKYFRALQYHCVTQNRIAGAIVCLALIPYALLHLLPTDLSGSAPAFFGAKKLFFYIPGSYALIGGAVVLSWIV